MSFFRCLVCHVTLRCTLHLYVVHVNVRMHALTIPVVTVTCMLCCLHVMPRVTVGMCAAVPDTDDCCTH